MASNPEYDTSSTWMSERWEQVDRLLESALEREPGQRAAFLREVCAGDERLLREAESLLSSHQQAGDFLERPALAVASERFAVKRAESLVGRNIGPYELLSLLGSGGMGEVYRATDTRLNRSVAIKLLSADSNLDERRLQYFEREARLASALNHPNIVTIYDIGRSEFGPYIAMELVEGRTLRDILADGPLPLKRMLQVAAQVADGLAKAHAAGIFHRDLKPENLMIARDGLVKILDFGLAKLAPSAAPDQVPQAAKDALESKPGVILGTVDYMSPEQASGLPVDFRSDHFSLGTILYEMVTGRRAFDRATAVETLSAVIRDEPEPIAVVNPKVPAPCRWIIERCLAKNVDERYASTLDLAGDLRNLRDHFSEFSGWDTTNPLAVAPGTTKRFRALAWAGLAGLILAAAVNVLWLRNIRVPVPDVHALTFASGHVTGARFAADGQSVIYGAEWVGQDAQLYTTRPGNPESRPLGLGRASIWAVSPTGEMAIAYPCRINWGECVGTLARVPPGAGVPREVLEDVTSADWGGGGKTLVVAQLHGRKSRIVQFPGETILYESSGWVTNVRVSPDGDGIAFIDHPILGDIGGSVCVLDSDGKKKILSTGWKEVQGVAWFPGRDEVWFTGSRDGRGFVMRLFAVTLSGRERPVFASPSSLWLDDISRDGRRVLLKRVVPRAAMIARGPGDSKERDLSWFDFSTVADLSSDGKTLLFYEWGAGVRGIFTAYLRSTDAPEPKQLGEGKPLALSPDGQWALARQQTLPPQLVLLPTGAGQQKTLPRGAIGEFLDWAAWFPDGRIVFSAAEPGQRARTYIQDIDGGLPQPVTPEGIVGTLLSPDGRLIAAMDRYEQYYLYPTDGGESSALEGYVEGDVLLQWSRDGAIFLRAPDDMKLSIYKLDLKTGTRTLWKQLTPPYPAGLIGIGADPGEIRMTPDGQSYAYTFWTALNELYVIEGLK